MLFSKHVTIGAVAAGFIGSVTAAGFPFMRSQVAPAATVDLVTLDEREATTPHERLTSLQNSIASIQERLDEVSTMPSCKRHAARDLLSSCASFEDRRAGQIHSGNDILESYQDLFAIRATKCEHTDAFPSVCDPLFGDEHPSHVPRMNIKNCLKAMSSGGTNQWTTYNHIKTDSSILCHVVRTETDKDDLIYLYQILSGTLGDMGAALSHNRDELNALMTGLTGIRDQAREFQDALYRDNQDIKTEMKGFSIGLKDSMAEIGKHAQLMHQTIAQYRADFKSAMELAKSRGDRADAQLVMQVETQQYALNLLQEKYGFTMQQMMDSFYAFALNMSQSVAIANDQTSILVHKIGDLSVGMDAPLEKLTELNSVTNELSGSVHNVHAASKATEQTLERVDKLAGGFLAFVETCIRRFGGLFKDFGSFSMYFMALFPVTLIFWALLISRWWAPVAACVIAGYLSVIFVFVHSPVSFGCRVVANHPVIFSPAIWSVLTSIAIGISIWEVTRMIYRYFCRTTKVDFDDFEGMDEKA